MLRIHVCMNFKYKPRKLAFSEGLIILSSLILSVGAGAIEMKQFNNSLTPKLFKADPKNTGCCLHFK